MSGIRLKAPQLKAPHLGAPNLGKVRLHGLRTRIIAWSFVPTVIVLFAVSWAAFYAYQQVTQDLMMERNQEVARLSAGQLAAGFSQYSALLGVEARSLDPVISDPAALASALSRVSNRLVVFDGGVVVIDNLGKVAATWPEQPDPKGQDWSDRPWFREVIRTRGPVFSDITTDGPSGKPVVLVAVPVSGAQGEFLGTLAGMFRLDSSAVSAFYGGIVKLRIGRSTTYMVDSTGHVIYHSQGAHIGEDLSREPAVQAVVAGQAGNLRSLDESGRALLAGYAPVPGTPWGLVTEESWSSLLSASREYGSLLLFLLGLGIVVPVIILAFGIRQITRPIEELKAAAKEVASGNFDKRISVPTGDELQELAEQFNVMSLRLQESYAHLEQRVAARTRELAALNSIAAVVNSTLDLDEILEEALDRTMEVTGMDAGEAYRLEQVEDCAADGGPCLVLQAFRGLPENVRHLSERIPLDRSIVRHAFEQGGPVVMTLNEYPENELRRAAMGIGLRLLVSIPVTAKGRNLGAITLASRIDRAVSPEERALLASIGHQVGIAVENARLYEEAEEVATAAERSRLARDLHDAVSQTLFSASLIAEVLPRLFERSPEEALRRLSELRQLTRGALAEMRTLLLELRPAALSQIPLADLVRQLGDSTIGRARVPVSVSVEGQAIELRPDVQIVLYRVCQESLNNVAKHSGASAASVTLRYMPAIEGKGGVELSVRDNGHGFDPAAVGADHLGLGIMRERAESIGGECIIRSQPGVGTEVTIIWTDLAL